jgi:hypothetical protein
MSGELTAALTAEYAAIYAYGPIGVRLTGKAAELARAAEAAHRARRDELVLLLGAAGTPVPPAQPAYTLPFAVTDAAAALRLAVEVEERTSTFWWAALAATEGGQRTTVLAGLTDCAVRATRWRRLAGMNPLTVAFPGRPG